jgi:hypothetical protein
MKSIGSNDSCSGWGGNDSTYAPTAAKHLPPAALHHIALARHRNIGCFDTALEAEYLGWMNTSQGRRSFGNSSRTIRSPPSLGWRTTCAIQCPVAVIWGDRDP